MGTFTPAHTLNPYALLLPDARSTPDEGQKRQAGRLQFVLQANPVDLSGGYGTGWGSNRYEQLAHYRGILYIALRAYLAAMGASRFTLLRKTPKTVKKSVGGRGNYSRDDEYEPVPPGDHPLATVLERPGGDDGAMSMHEECAYLTLQHMLTGDAPAWFPHNADGKPVRFFALTSANMTQAVPMGTDPRYPKGAYRFTPFGATGMFAAGGLHSQATLPGEEVGFFRMPHPLARSLAMSPLQAGDREIDCLEAITRARWSTFDKGVHVDKVFILPGAGPDEAELLQKKLEQNFGGASNAGRTLVMSGAAIDAKLDVKMLAPNVREMDYGASYDQAAGVVASLFGVPKELINFGMDSNYSKDWAAKQRFYDDALSPYCRNLSAFLTRTLARAWEESPGELKIEVEPQLPKNIETEEKRRDTGLQTGAVYVNEWRAGANMPPVPDGDVPLQVYVAKLQQQLAPPPAPMPGDPNAAPGAEGAAALPPGDAEGAAAPGAEPPAEDTPEATQDATAQAALAALGVPAEEEQPAEPLAKAVTPRAEGERWQVGSQWYVKRGGRAVKTAAPGTANPRVTKPGQGKPQAAQVAPAASAPKGDKPGDIAAFGAGAAGAINDNYYSAVKDSLAKTGDVPRAERAAGSAVAQAWDRVKGAGLDKHPEAHDRFTAAAREASAAGGGGKAWLDALNKNFAGAGDSAAPAGDDERRVWNPKDHYSHPMSKETKALSDRVAGLMGGPSNSPAAQKIKRKMEADGTTDLLLTPEVIAELSKGAYPKGDYSDLAGHTVRLNVGPNKVGDRVGRTGQVTHVIPPKSGGGSPPPASPASAAPSPGGAHPHDALAAKFLNGRPSLRLLDGNLKGHTISDGKSLQEFFDKGGKLPPEHFGESAKSVPAATPTARKTLLSVKTWARMHADKHADRVAKHFGIPKEKAHLLLMHAIVETAKLAAKHGSTRATGTLNQNGMKLRVNINGKVNPAPAKGAAAVPKPSNPDAAGSRGAPVAKAIPASDTASSLSLADGGALVESGAVLRRRRKRARACVARVLKSLETEG